MRVKVRMHGAPRVALGLREREMEVPEGATIADLVSEIVEEVGSDGRAYLLDPQGRGYVVVFLVNGQSATPERALIDGDQVTIMPPVGGGRA